MFGSARRFGEPQPVRGCAQRGTQDRGRLGLSTSGVGRAAGISPPRCHPRGGEFACAATPVSAHRIGSQILRIDPNVPPPAYIQLVCSMCLTSSRSSAMIKDILSTAAPENGVRTGGVLRRSRLPPHMRTAF